MVMRIINYTNVCVAQCDYCAFYVLPNQDGGYVLSREDVFAKIDDLVALGGDLVAFNGGFNPRLPLDYYCDLFAAVRERYGDPTWCRLCQDSPIDGMAEPPDVRGPVAGDERAARRWCGRSS